MRRLLGTLLMLMLLLSASVAWAKSASLLGCTTDNKAVSIDAELANNVSASVQKHIQETFAAVASSMSYEEFSSVKGYQAWLSELSEEDKNNILGISGQPQIVGDCKSLMKADLGK